jgi:hypothetical protein
MTGTDLYVNKPQSVPVIFEPPCIQETETKLHMWDSEFPQWWVSNYSLLGHDAVQFGRSIATFQKKLAPPSSRQKSPLPRTSDAAGSSKMLEPIYQTIPHYIPQNHL